jgi:hypothetical protein
MKEKIYKDKYYSALQISKMGILPWKSPYTFNLKLNSKKGREMFKPLIEQHKENKTYKIKGENIIKFLTNLEKGNINL